MAKASSYFRWSYVFVSVWLVFTLSLIGWWMVFGMRQIGAMRILDPSEESQLVRQQHMLLWEGSTLFFSLGIGAAALIAMTFRAAKQARLIKEFLAVFTHEMKTPLASLRLQAESLADASNGASPDIVAFSDRLVGDTARLSLRLDNALFVATKGKEKFFIETISLQDVIDSLKLTWPNLAINGSDAISFQSDRRAIETIFSNILLNSITHGKATQVTIDAVETKQHLEVTIRDDGKGFQGDFKNLGKLFSRTYQGSGSSIGLHTVKETMKAMGGNTVFKANSSSPGFAVQLLFPRGPSHE